MYDIKRIAVYLLNFSLLLVAIVVTFHDIYSIPKPTIGLNFTAADAINNNSSVSHVPSNQTGDVGPKQYIMSSLQSLRTYNKTTGKLDGVINIDASSFGFDGGGASVDDQQILFDRFAQRWIYSYESQGATALEFAVSDAAVITPETQWSFYVVEPFVINPVGGNVGNAFIDLQQPGYDQNAWYNGVAAFDVNGNFVGSSLAIVSQNSILNGSPKVTVFPGLFPEVINFPQEGFAYPATNFDSNPKYGYFLWLIYDAPASISGNQLQLYRILNAGSDKPTLGPRVSRTIPQFAYNGLLCPHKGNLFGTPGLLQNGLGRIMPTPHVRNKQLYLCQDIQIDHKGNASVTGDRMGIRWYQFDLTGDPSGQGLGIESPDTKPVLIQHGTLFDKSLSNPLFYFNSSILTNKHGDLCISFSQAGVNSFINAGYAYRTASDAKGTLPIQALVTNSKFPYNFAPNVPLLPGPNLQRWGDASVVAIDPDGDTTFWLTQQWAALNNAWGIQSTQVIPAQ